MKQSVFVLRVQLALFVREKGMIGFYLGCVIVIGVLIPVVIQNLLTPVIMALFLTMMFLKPLLADSMAGERDRKTLEPLLSAPITGSRIIWGKAAFCLLFAICFFTAILLCLFTVIRLFIPALGLAAWQWLCIFVPALPGFAALSIVGVYTSALSGDLRTANRRVFFLSYTLGLASILIPSVVIVSGDPLVTAVISAIIVIFYSLILLIYAIKAARLYQPSYYEHIKIRQPKKMHGERFSNIRPGSQFTTVFLHEIRYLRSLKSLLLQFCILCFAPAIFSCLFAGNVNVAILITAFMMPRIPSNLIAYSIGGEKVYKTGESLLATPLHIRSLFLAKSAVPVLFSAAMLVISCAFTIMMQTIHSGTDVLAAYTVTQFVLLFPANLLSCIGMIFLSGILTAAMHTPRKAYFATSFIGMFFVLPVAAMIFLAQNTLLWSIVYCIVLLIGSAVCVAVIANKTSRPQLMMRL